MDKNKKRAIRILAVFLAVMALCTVISRAAASVLVAQVKVEKIKKGRLTYTWEGKGQIVPAQETKLFLWPQQQVESAAKEGSTVKAGDCLVQFRAEYLQQTIDKKQAEVERLRLQREQQQVSARGSQRVSSAAGAALTLQSAQNRLAEAEQKAAEAQAAYDGAEAGGQGEEGTGGQPGAEEDPGIQEQKQALYQALQSAQAEVQSANQALEDAQNAYDLACREDAAQEANDANAREAAELGVQDLNVQTEQAESELQKLREYQDSGGKICAEQDCVVLRSGIQEGAVTTGSEILVLGSGGWRLRGSVSGEDKEQLSAGKEVEITLPSSEKRILKIESVENADSSQSKEEGQSQSEGQSGSGASGETVAFWYAPLPERVEGVYNKAFTWTAKTESQEEYEQMIPLSALREGTDGTYCLILTESSGMLGTVQSSKRVPVSVLEKDSQNAAVIAELSREDQIIVSSEKYVEEGDQVRIIENAN